MIIQILHSVTTIQLQVDLHLYDFIQIILSLDNNKYCYLCFPVCKNNNPKPTPGPKAAVL